MIDLRSIKPNKVSTNYSKHSIHLAGIPKSGKTTTMFEILGEKALFIELEDGAEAIPGINYVRCYNYADIKEVCWQLADMKESGDCPFDSIVFDTCDMLETMLVKAICSANSVQELGDIPHGKGYAMLDKWLLNLLLELKALNIGIHFISHTKLKKIEDKINGLTYEKYLPSTSERFQKIILADCYFMAFIYTKINPETQEEQRVMCFRDTVQFLAGSRFKYMPAMIPLSAEHFKKAVEMAIAKEEEVRKGSTTTEVKVDNKSVLDFKSIMAKGSELGAKLQGAGHVDKLMEMVTETLGVDENGKPRMFNQLKESQVETAHILVMKLERLAKELGL